jgi:hypothetical protein
MTISADDPRRQGHRRTKRFGHKDKLVAVVASEVNGVSETAKALRVTKRQLDDWRDDAVLQPYVQAARNQIMGDASTVASKAWQELLLRLSNEPEEFGVRDLVAVAAEATSKMQLLSGGATSRTETRDVSLDVSPEEMEVIVYAARRHLERYGPGGRSALAEGAGLEIPAKAVTDPA